MHNLLNEEKGKERRGKKKGGGLSLAFSSTPPLLPVSFSSRSISFSPSRIILLQQHPHSFFISPLSFFLFRISAPNLTTPPPPPFASNNNKQFPNFAPAPPFYIFLSFVNKGALLLDSFSPFFLKKPCFPLSSVLIARRSLASHSHFHHGSIISTRT